MSSKIRMRSKNWPWMSPTTVTSMQSLVYGPPVDEIQSDPYAQNNACRTVWAGRTMHAGAGGDVHQVALLRHQTLGSMDHAQRLFHCQHQLLLEQIAQTLRHQLHGLHPLFRFLSRSQCLRIKNTTTSIRISTPQPATATSRSWGGMSP